MNIKRQVILLGTSLLWLSLVLLWLMRSIGTDLTVAHAAGPWYVAPGGSDSNSCDIPAAPCATINGALNKATGGDTIYVTIGTYTGTGDEVVLIEKDITISGGWDSTFTNQNDTSIIDGEELRRGIVVNSENNAILMSFVIQNGSAPYSSSYGYRGDGIFNHGTLTLNNSIISNNTGGGSAIENYSTLILNESIVSSNIKPDPEYGVGGGINNTNDGVLILNHSTVSGNTAGSSGGGISNWSGITTLNHSTVSNNTAGSQGGGIYLYDGIVILNNSTVSGNTSEYGGGISSSGYYGSRTITLKNSTISKNFANSDGGGIRNYYSTINLQNSILAENVGNSGPDCSGLIDSAGYNLIGNTSGCTFTLGTDDLTDLNANIGQLIGAPMVPRYHPLLAGSPAINAGNPAGCTDHMGNPLDTDQRGAPRVDRCDIGSYEYTIPGPTDIVAAIGGTPQRTPPSHAFLKPLQAAVMDSIGSPVSGTVIVFSAPLSGPSGTFVDSGTYTTTGVTGESGVVTAASFMANELMGSYTVTAMVSGDFLSTNFLLDNIGWYVTPTGEDSDDCLSPSTSCATINATLNKPDFVEGDTILVAEGIYTGTGDEVVLLNKDATLSGGWDDTFFTQGGISTIDGEGSRRGITISSDKVITVIAEQLVVKNGFVNGEGYPDHAAHGGGIYNSGNLTLINCSIQDSVATSITISSGGGIYNNSQGTLILIDSSTNSNSAYLGGGIYNGGGKITLNNSTVANSTRGNGIVNWGGTTTLNNSNINGNAGGGINLEYGLLIINNSTISKNFGHGIGVGSGDLSLVNSTISGNTSEYCGGGISNWIGTTSLYNSTLKGNTVLSEGGGGICNSYIGTVTLQNSILAGNTGAGSQDCLGTIDSSGYNLIGDTTGCTFTPTTGDLTNTDPLLGPLEGSPGYHPILPDSPAINAGSPIGCMGSTGLLTTDQRGFPRFGNCDIGAYELQPIGFSTKTVNQTATVPGDDLAYTIDLKNPSTTNIASILVTDTLPVHMTYIDNSLIATDGSYGYSSGVITWTGTVNSGEIMSITFGASISQTVPPGTLISNSAIISGGGEIITRTAHTEIIPHQIFLPCIYRN